MRTSKLIGSFFNSLSRIFVQALFFMRACTSMENRKKADAGCCLELFSCKHNDLDYGFSNNANNVL